MRNAFVFIYKKGNKLIFYNFEDDEKSGNDLLANGWEHISTIEASITLACIYEICNEKDSSAVNKIDDIRTLLNSK